MEVNRTKLNIVAGVLLACLLAVLGGVAIANGGDAAKPASFSAEPAGPALRYFAEIYRPGQKSPNIYGPYFRYSTAANVVAAFEAKGCTGKVIERR